MSDGASDTVEITEGWKPGALGFIISEHGCYYAREWRFGRYFEAKVAAELGVFMGRYDADRGDRLFLAFVNGQVVGSLVLDLHHPDAQGREARLRWFILADAARGRGAGTALMQAAMAHLDACQIACTLGTFAGLDAARSLYERHDFTLAHEVEAASWGVVVREQLFRRPVQA